MNDLMTQQPDERRELSEYHTALMKASPDGSLSSRDKWLLNHVSSYVSCLRLKYEAPSSRPRLAAQAAKLRSNQLVAFDSYFGRETTPDDILRSRWLLQPVPAAVGEAIRRDFEELRGRRNRFEK